MDLSPYKREITPFISYLKKEFTKEEINIIKKNKDYYIQSEFIKDKVPLFNDNSLYEVLNNEEKEEEIERKKVKVFHNLNYYDNRRKSVILNLNDVNKSGNNSFNKTNKNDKNNNNINFYKTSLINNKDNKIEKNQDTSNLDNLSHYYVKKHKLEIIEKDIRKKVKKMKKENEKLHMINEQKKNLVNDMTKESEFEIKRILGDNNFYNIGNSYDRSNEVNLFKKKKKNINNKTDNSLPLINNGNQTLLNLKNTDRSKSIFISASNQIQKKNFSEIKDMKYKRNIFLYKKDKMNELREKNEENEQIILKDIHKRIKSIYDSLKYK